MDGGGSCNVDYSNIYCTETFVVHLKQNNIPTTHVGSVYKTLYASYDYRDFSICFHLRDAAFTQSSLSAQVNYTHGMWACHFGDATLC